MNDSIKILNWSMGNRIEAKWLPWYKVLIYRMFKIEMPPVKWWVEAIVIVEPEDSLQLGDILLISEYGKWFVLERKYKFYTITTMEPILEHSPEYTGNVTRIGSAKIES